MMLVQIAGRLGRDPETRFTPKGLKVTNLNIATNVRKGKEEKTVWWRVTIWGETFDYMLPYLKKGSALYVMGEMNPPETYQNREGHSQVSLEMKANYIGFNPFGSAKDGEEPKSRAGNSDSSDSESPYAFSQASRGQGFSDEAGDGGNSDNPFQDDDIPF